MTARGATQRTSTPGRCEAVVDAERQADYLEAAREQHAAEDLARRAPGGRARAPTPRRPRPDGGSGGRRALVRRRRPVERLRHVVEERARRSLARRGNPLYLDLSAGARVQGGRVERGRAGGGVRGRDGDSEDGLLTALDALVDGLGETAPVAATGRQRREQPTVRVEVRDLVAERLHQRDVVGDDRAAEVVRDAAQQGDVGGSDHVAHQR